MVPRPQLKWNFWAYGQKVKVEGPDEIGKGYEDLLVPSRP